MAWNDRNYVLKPKNPSIRFLPCPPFRALCTACILRPQMFSSYCMKQGYWKRSLTLFISFKSSIFQLLSLFFDREVASSGLWNSFDVPTMKIEFFKNLWNAIVKFYWYNIEVDIADILLRYYLAYQPPLTNLP